MIRPLRRRHDILFVLLALALPTLYAAALAVRPDPTLLRADVPAALFGPPHEVTAEDSHRVGLPTLDVSFGELPNSPALLLYWVPQLSVSPAAESVLPGGARLLGVARSHNTARFPHPAPLIGGGALLLYSLGHQSVVGEAVALQPGAFTEAVQVGEHAEGSADR